LASARKAIRDSAEGYLFASPFIVGFVLWIAYPMLYSVWLVLHDWDLLTPPRFAGLKNVNALLSDQLVGVSLANTAVYSFVGVPLHLTAAFLLALLLNQQLRGQAIYRTAFYLPSITPIVATAVLWSRIFHEQYGLLNDVLGLFGVPAQQWLFQPELAKPALIMVGFWSIGPAMVIFLAGLQNVPPALLEAASIDGAGPLRRFWYVVVPMISPVILFNLVIGIIHSFQVFALALVMTDGGPQNATLFAVLYLYRNAFQYFRMGYASTFAWVLFLIIVGLTLVQFAVARRWVYYEEAR
jgi:multiple sugar transport system permease protein